MASLLEHAQTSIVLVDRFDRHNSDLNVVALYASLIEYLTAAYVLTQKRLDSGANSIFRSFLEAYVDIKNQCEDEEYREQVIYEYHLSWLKTLKAAEDKNPYLFDLADAPDLADRMQIHRTYIEKAEAAGLRKMQIRAKFEKAGMLNEYQSIYGSVSSGAHNGFRHLISRHLTFGEDTTNININQFDADGLKPILDGYCGLMLHATKLLGERFAILDHMELDRLAAELKDARS